MPHPIEKYLEQDLTEEDLAHILTHTGRVWETLRDADIFVTGGSGFVGSWLVESLLWANARLNLNARAVLLTRSAAAFRRKFPRLAAEQGVTLLEGDASSFAFPEGRFRCVIHAATEAADDFLRDADSTRRMLEFARTHRTERFLFTSSGAVYGKQPAGLTHIPEDYLGAPATVDAQSGYGQAKRASEFLCAAYARHFGFAAVIGRLFAFSGPRLPLDSNFAIGNFVRDAISGGPIRIAGDGTPYRSYLYAADLAIWLWTLLIEGQSARPYNVGSGEQVSIAELAKKTAECSSSGCAIEIAREPIPGVEPARYVPSVERAKQELGLRVLVPLDEGIRRMYLWNTRPH
jgi:dTDP-glucose 4,6-dehydratase